MRKEDLIPSFLWEANRLRLTKDERKGVRMIQSRIKNSPMASFWFRGYTGVCHTTRSSLSVDSLQAEYTP